MKKVIVSAPGKLHLSGEHAVIYGKPALVVATSLRLYATLESGKRKKTDPYIEAIISAFEKKHGVTVHDISYTIHSSVPEGAGMGSSAALAVALTGALSVWHGFPWNAQSINEIAYQAEKVKHANSSGSDPAVATHGGILWYRKEMEFLKTLWLLPFKIPKTFAPFVLINTSRSENTGDLVAYVAKHKKWELFPKIEDVTRVMAVSIHDEDETGFRKRIAENEKLLELLGVVSASVKTFIRAIETAGGVAKISGAGGRMTGSGVVIAVHDSPSVLIGLAKKYHYPSFQVKLGGEGVKLEQVLA